MEIIVGVFGFILTILGTVLIFYLKDIKETSKNTSKAIVAINLKMERVITDKKRFRRRWRH